MKEYFSLLKKDFGTIIKSLSLVKIYLGKNYFSLTLAVKSLRAVSPYITIYFTGLALTALTEERSFRELIAYVLAATVSTLIIDIIIRLLNRKALILLNSCWEKHAAMLSRKLLELDYAKAESSFVQELRGKVEMNADSGRGLSWVANCFAGMISCVFSIIVALFMISGMVFSKSDKPLTGLAAIVDSPISAVVLIILSAIAIAVSTKYHSQSERSEFNIFNKASYVPLME